MLAADVYNLVRENGIDFFTGVPDSLLADFCAYLADTVPSGQNIIAANEGSAAALACGHYLATGNVALVYMQNSGQGNAVNPLLSLADPEVYSIPMLLVIGWRGEPGVHDEPQHIKQGRVTCALFDAMEIPYEIMPNSLEECTEVLRRLFAAMRERKGPAALIVKKGSFEKYARAAQPGANYELNRENALGLIIEQLQPRDAIVSTTGMTSRELFELREARGEGHGNDFLTVGSMGHAISIALGVALARPARQVFCIDGDGAALMHMGALPVAATLGAANLKHIVINNGAHDSVGGQATCAFSIDLAAIAKADGYRWAERAETSAEITQAVRALRDQAGPAFLEIRVRKGARKDLGRPTTSTYQNRDAFMQFLRDEP
ncbi:MAG: phosphonopyruvate decarboxylase [Spirochaetota bacterium]|jgi:phosphonopyruvate decarboxylase|nr:phosphonopyruvate decarboxylase [Spirochaetota bacterium]